MNNQTNNTKTINRNQLITFQVVETDTRGRNYPSTVNSGQGGFVQKSQLMGPKQCLITPENEELLLKTFNGLVDGREVKREELLELNREVRARLHAVARASSKPRGNQPSRRNELLRDFHLWAEEEWDTTPARLQYGLHYAKDLIKYLENPNAETYTRRYIFIDAKTNAIQHLAPITGNKEFAKYGGLAGKEAEDAYLAVGTAADLWVKHGNLEEEGSKKVKEALEARDAEGAEPFVQLEGPQLRKLMKNAVMTRLYGAGNATIRAGVLKAANKLGIPEWQRKLFGLLAWPLMVGFLSGNRATLNGTETIGLGKPEEGEGESYVVLEEFFSTLKGAFPSDEEGFRGIDWKTSPGGFHLFRASKEGDDARVSVVFKPVDEEGKPTKGSSSEVMIFNLSEAEQLHRDIAKRKLSRDKSLTAAAPDLVHSLDGGAMRLLFLSLELRGVHHAHHIHDCVAVQLDDVPETLDAFREVHYAEYSATGYDPLRFIAAQVLDNLRLNKPNREENPEEFALWELRKEAALEAQRSSTAERYLQGENGEWRSVSQLMELIHESAFEAE